MVSGEITPLDLETDTMPGEAAWFNGAEDSARRPEIYFSSQRKFGGKQGFHKFR